MSDDKKPLDGDSSEPLAMADEALNHEFNDLTSKTIDFLHDATQSLALSKEKQFQLLLLVAEAVVFNFIMHVAEHTDTDPRQLAKHSKQNLQNAVTAMVQPGPGDAIH